MGFRLKIGRISELRILDVSRNSLTQRIPRELEDCKKLSAVKLTNLEHERPFSYEHNAFYGGIPAEVLLLPSLEIFWAPRANLSGRLPSEWSEFCSLRVLNLGGNHFKGTLPGSVSMCKNITFLDLSSNGLVGSLPRQLHVPCMLYFNVSQNSLSGLLPTMGTPFVT